MAVDCSALRYNMMIYEVRDFCTALVDVDGELISQNVGGVSHFVADLGVIITDAVKRYGRKGSSRATSSSPTTRRGGAALNNVVIYLPYFFKGELLAFAMVRAHWIDVGGTSTGFGAGPRCRIPGRKACSSISSRSTTAARSTRRSTASSATTSVFRNLRWAI